MNAKIKSRLSARSEKKKVKEIHCLDEVENDSDIQQVRQKSQQNAACPLLEPIWYRMAEPYHPSMSKHIQANIDAFINQCRGWSKTEFEDFHLDTGEHVIIKTVTKDISSPNHSISLKQIFVDSMLLAQDTLFKKNGNTSMGRYGYFSPRHSALEKALLERVRRATANLSRVNEVKPILERIFSPNYDFPGCKTDEAFCALIHDLVSFGNLEDCKKTQPIKDQPTGARVGYQGTVRPFVSGKYVVTIIHPFEGCDPLAIFHHSSIDPKKIMKQVILMADDYCDYHRHISNSVNRYDWCSQTSQSSVDCDEGIGHYDQSPGACSSHTSEVTSTVASDKMKQLVFFTNTNFSACFKDAVSSGQTKRSELVPELYKVIVPNDNTVALAVDLKSCTKGEWLYGKTFQDSISQRYFALVVNANLGVLDSHNGMIPQSVKTLLSHVEFTSVAETGLVFNMKKFQQE